MRAQIESDIRGWDALPEHRTGTPGDDATAQWLAGLLRDAGAEPHIDTFPFARRIPTRCVIEIDGRSVPGVPLFDGGTTNATGIAGPLAPLAPLTGPAAIAAGIAVTRFESVGGASAQTLDDARRSDSHRAIVAVAAGNAVVPGLALRNADAYTAPFGPPVLQVATEHGPWLDQAAQRGATARLTAHVTTDDTTASNVHATIPGGTPGLAPLVVMTPRSAWWTCTAERGGGIAAWFATLRRFAADRPQRDVIFTANTGHELGHVGLDHHLATHPGLAAGAHAWLHLGANFAALEGAIRYQSSDDEFLALGVDQLSAAGVPPTAVAPIGPRPGGEARNIYDAGGRYLSLIGGNRWFHHPDDRWPDTVDLAKTERVVRAVLAIADALAHA
ncbi:MAG: hypothetical protein DK306_001617 [Chloroflexi bacterium]|nr:MAG: hypothetical protein DK306_001617 [Chloroflexota bacterium]